MNSYEAIYFLLGAISAFFFTYCLSSILKWKKNLTYRTTTITLAYWGLMYLTYLPALSPLWEVKIWNILRDLYCDLAIPVLIYAFSMTSQLTRKQLRCGYIYAFVVALYSVLEDIDAVPRIVSLLLLFILMAMNVIWAVQMKNHVNKYERDLIGLYSKRDLKAFQVYKVWLVVFVSMFCIWCLRKMMVTGQARMLGIDEILFVLVALMFFLANKNLVEFKGFDHDLRVKKTPPPKPEPETQEPVMSAPKPSASDMAFETIRQNLVLLARRENYFLQSNLTIQDLATKLGTNRSYLSNYFSSRGTSFLEYVELQRVKYAVRLMHKEPNLLMDVVALRSGFGSRTSFYRSFNKVYKTSPKQYHDEVIAHNPLPLEDDEEDSDI